MAAMHAIEVADGEHAAVVGALGNSAEYLHGRKRGKGAIIAARLGWAKPQLQPTPGAPASGALASPFPVKAGDVVGECAGCDGVAQVAHQLLVIVQVVDGGQPRAEDLVKAVEVVQIAPGEIAAGVAGAGWIDGVRIFAILRLFDDQLAGAGEEAAVAGVA